MKQWMYVAAALAVLWVPVRADAATVVTNSAELTAALAAAQPGETIVVKKGDYVGPFTLMDKMDVTVRGQGKPTISTVAGDGFDIFDCMDITLTGLVFDGTQNHGMEIVDSKDVTVTKCTIRNTGADGVQTEGCQRVTISRCDLDDIGDDGLALQENDADVPTTDSTVTKNKIDRTMGNGVKLMAAGTTVSKNKINDCNENGVLVNGGPGTGDNIVTKNKINDTIGCGVIAGADRTEVSKNKLTEIGEDALDLEADGSMAVKNKVDDAVFGIDVEADNLTVDRNVFKGITQDAVTIFGQMAMVTRNKAIMPGRHGFRLQPNTSGTTLDRNSSKNAGTHGFLLEGINNTLTRNKAKNSGGMNLQDDSGGPNTIDANNKF